MKSFRNYVDEPQERNNDQTASENKAEESASAEQLGKRIAAAYNGKSNADIWKNILSEAEKSRRAGTLSDAEIDAFYQTFSPMLNSTQRKKLQSIVEKLKSI